MKRASSVALAIVFCLVTAFILCADPGQWEGKPDGVEDEKKLEVKSIMQCQNPDPMKQIWGKFEDCLKCHTVPNFKVKEANIAEGYDLPFGTELIERNGKLVAYFMLNSIESSSQLRNFFEWCNRHNEIDTTIVEIKSYGGAVFEGLECVGIMRHWWTRFHVITMMPGYGFSMGFVAMQGGETRLVDRFAQGMAHEMWSIAFLKVDTPASLETDAKEYRTIQTNLSKLMIDRTKVPLEDIEKRMHKKNWWLSGEEMIEFGFADGYTSDFGLYLQ
jgi:ATP-dependent protease ClpP protease subunit